MREKVYRTIVKRDNKIKFLKTSNNLSKSFVQRFIMEIEEGI